MVLMNGSKKARNQDSLVNQTNTMGGPKKAGIPSLIGLNSNLYGPVTKRCFPAVGFFPIARYGSTVKGTVGMKYPYM
jgi:hypothetical protein